MSKKPVYKAKNSSGQKQTQYQARTKSNVCNFEESSESTTCSPPNKHSSVVVMESNCSGQKIQYPTPSSFNDDQQTGNLSFRLQKTCEVGQKMNQDAEFSDCIDSAADTKSDGGQTASGTTYHTAYEN